MQIRVEVLNGVGHRFGLRVFPNSEGMNETEKAILNEGSGVEVAELLDEFGLQTQMAIDLVD